MKIISCIDLDYFYAQCEEILNPNLKNKPVVVCIYSGRGEEGGAVATANYIARRYGVKAGMSIFRAKKLLSNVDAYFIDANLELYEEISSRVMSIIKKYADIFEQVSIDEAFLDITYRCNFDFNQALSYMKKLKEEIYEKEKLTCSIGIGPTKVIAKIASGLNKPNGLTLVKPNDIEKIIWPLPVDEIPGIGPKTKKILEKLNIKTIEDLAKYDYLKLTSVFGKKIASYLYLSAQGKETEGVKESTDVEQLNRMITLKENTLNFKEILPYLEQIVKELVEDLKNNKFLAGGIGVMAILEDFSTISKSQVLDLPTDSYEEIYKIAENLLFKLIQKSNKLFRRISVKAYNLVSIKGIRKLEEFSMNN